jgi:hypothetical protein
VFLLMIWNLLLWLHSWKIWSKPKGFKQLPTLLSL